MNLESKKNFIIFLESNPKLYSIAKSEVCLNLLEQLSEQGLPVNELKRLTKFSYMHEKDIEELLELLVELKILSKEKIVGKIIYYANDKTKLFLEIYNDAKRKYTVGYS